MAASGAKVMALRSVEFARSHSVRLHVRSTFADADGTWISEEDERMLEKAIISGVRHARRRRSSASTGRDRGGSSARSPTRRERRHDRPDRPRSSSRRPKSDLAAARARPRAPDGGAWSARTRPRQGLADRRRHEEPSRRRGEDVRDARRGRDQPPRSSPPRRSRSPATCERATSIAPCRPCTTAFELFVEAARRCLGSASSARPARSARSRSNCSRERGYDDVRAFASARSAGASCRSATLVVEEATPEALAAGDIDLFLFSVGTSASRELVPHAVRGGAICVDKSSAYRLEPGIPLVVPEVNGARALEHDGIVANPNCCTIPLTCVLKPLHDAAGPRARARRDLPVGLGRRARSAWSSCAASRRPSTTCAWTGTSTATSSTRSRSCARRRARSWSCPSCRSARRACACRCWSATPRRSGSRPSSRSRRRTRREILARRAERARRAEFPSPGKAAGGDDVLVGRIRRDPTVEHGLALFLASDNLRKGAALNAIQIAELLLERPRRA